MEINQSVQQLKQQLQRAVTVAEEKVRRREETRMHREAERKKTRMHRERMAREQARKEEAARVKQAAERKAREKAGQQQWSFFESMLQGEESKAKALLEKALAAKKYSGPGSCAEIQLRIDQLAQLRQQGEQLKQRAGPGQAEQQELKRQLEELSASIAHRPQQSRLRASEMDLLHVTPFDVTSVQF
jgi:hypothetical protein